MIPFSVTQVPLRPVHNTASFLAQGVPVFEMRKAAGMTDNLVSDSARAKALVETLGDRPVALLRGHGDVVVGPALRRTVARAIYTEVNARMLLQAVTLGGPITFIDPEEAKSERGQPRRPDRHPRRRSHLADVGRRGDAGRRRAQPLSGPPRIMDNRPQRTVRLRSA